MSIIEPDIRVPYIDVEEVSKQAALATCLVIIGAGSLTLEGDLGVKEALKMHSASSTVVVFAPRSLGGKKPWLEWFPSDNLTIAPPKNAFSFTAT